MEADGQTVALGILTGYDANVREVLSVGVIDSDYAEPGTEVTLIWGEADSPKRTVERHVEKPVTATVAAAPYSTAREDL